MNGICLILAFVIGWFLAQGIKLVTGFVQKKIKKEKFTLSDFLYYAFKSGGMPSGHTASFIALSTEMFLLYGLNNPATILSFCTTAIFIYDAVNVRYAVGEHGKLLNEIAESDNNSHTKPQKIVEGHTISQAIVGAILGIIVAISIFAISGGDFAKIWPIL